MSRESRKGKILKILLRRFLYSFETLIFPSFCSICGSPLDEFEKLVCKGCLAKINPMEDNVCLKCGKPLSSPIPNQICLSCIESPPLFTLHRSFSLYDGILREIILLMKFRKFKILGKVLARIAYENLKDFDSLFDCDLIIPVPISKKRMAMRGFNQSEVIAEELSRLTKRSILKNVLIKKIDTIPQSLLSLRERIENVRGSFEIKNGELLKGKRILLVDDIYTTGSTISECCKVLLKAGAVEVKVFTIAQGGKSIFPLSLEKLDS
jgi:ComF family protein